MNNEEKSKYVHDVFENIHNQYDKANNRISFGLQKKWKEDLVNKILEDTPKNGKVLDVCCGTGDISISLAEKRGDLSITGVDFSSAMLNEAVKKSENLNIVWQKADALSLPFEDSSFSVATISFGLRNTVDYEKVLKEMIRVVKKDGYIYCLDSFVPDNMWIQPFYKMYFKYIMPLFGGGKKYYKEYVWLYESTEQFLKKKELIFLYEKLALKEIKYCSKMCGACLIIQGKK